MSEILSAAVSGGEGSVEGELPWDWDAEKIAVASAEAAAAAACTSVGVGLAAPLCAEIGGAVADWAIDNVVGPLGDFFGGIFQKKAEEKLITGASWSERVAHMTADAEWILFAQITNAQREHFRFGLRDPYGFDVVDWRLKVRGLELPRIGRRDPNGAVQDYFLPPDFTAEWEEKYGDRDPIRTVTTHRTERGRRVPVETTVDMRPGWLDAFKEERLGPWYDSLDLKLAEEIRFLGEEAIGQYAALAALQATANLPRWRAGVAAVDVSIESRAITTAMQSQVSAIRTKKEEEKPGVSPLVWIAGAGAVAGIGWWLWKRAA